FAVCWLRTARLSVRVARSEGFEVLQACNPPDTYWLLGLLWKSLAGKAFVFDQHDLCPEVYEARFARRGVLHRGLLALEQATYRVADQVIAPNPGYAEVAMTRGHVKPARVSIVMSTPDARRMVRGEVEPALRRGRRHLACYVGVMGPQDGVDRLVEAIHHYVNVLGRTDCHFGLIGFGDSLAALRERVVALGLGKWVTFTGRVGHDELGRWLSTASVGFTPDPPNEFNHRSTMNKTLEYMAHGVPVIATDLRETRRCAGDAARYTGDGEPAEVARALAELLDDPARRRQMGRVGRVRIERELAWETQAASYLSVIDRALSVRGRPRAGSPAPQRILPNQRRESPMPVTIGAHTGRPGEHDAMSDPGSTATRGQS
ncbi:MAG: glycosyltransferase family 4 protein, partial [Actinomycetota bacterium]